MAHALAPVALVAQTPRILAHAIAVLQAIQPVPCRATDPAPSTQGWHHHKVGGMALGQACEWQVLRTYSDYITNMASLRCERSTCELPAVAHNHDTLTMVPVLLPAAIVFNAAITWCMHTLLMGKGWRYQVQASQQPIRVVSAYGLDQASRDASGT